MHPDKLLYNVWSSLGCAAIACAFLFGIMRHFLCICFWYFCFHLISFFVCYFFGIRFYNSTHEKNEQNQIQRTSLLVVSQESDFRLLLRNERWCQRTTNKYKYSDNCLWHRINHQIRRNTGQKPRWLGFSGTCKQLQEPFPNTMSWWAWSWDL